MGDTVIFIVGSIVTILVALFVWLSAKTMQTFIKEEEDNTKYKAQKSPN
jgi:hypothetical protein